MVLLREILLRAAQTLDPLIAKYGSQEGPILLTVRAEIISELIPERVGPVISKSFLLDLITFRPIPVICPARLTRKQANPKRKDFRRGHSLSE